MEIINFFQELDNIIIELINNKSELAYLLLFTLVFSETGILFLGILPGDTFLFIAGTLAALGTLNYYLIMIILIAAAFLGNLLNYFVGKFLGNKIAHAKKKHFINKDSVDKATSFFEKYGSKTIVIAQVIPLVRTVSPFLAGTGSMNYTKFNIYNLIGATIRVFIYVSAGYLFGNVPFINNNLSLIVFIVVFIILLIVFITQIKVFFNNKKN